MIGEGVSKKTRVRYNKQYFHFHHHKITPLSKTRDTGTGIRPTHIFQIENINLYILIYFKYIDLFILIYLLLEFLNFFIPGNCVYLLLIVLSVVLATMLAKKQVHRCTPVLR